MKIKTIIINKVCHTFAIDIGSRKHFCFVLKVTKVKV